MTSLMRGGRFKSTPGLRRVVKEALRDDLIITPVLEEFYARNPDVVIDPKVARLIGRLLAEPQRDRRYSWSASQSGFCKRRQELAFLGVPAEHQHDTGLTRIFNNGTWVHRKWQAVLLTAGILNEVETGYRIDKLRARCSMDGQGVAKSSRFVGMDFGFELKGRNDYTYTQQASTGPDEKTRRQVDFEFFVSGLEVFTIVNENKNNSNYTEWVFYRNQERLQEVQDELRELNRAIDTQKLHGMIPECRRQERGGEFYKCPFGGGGGPCVMAGQWPSGYSSGSQSGQGSARSVPVSKATTAKRKPRRVIRL